MDTYESGRDACSQLPFLTAGIRAMNPRQLWETTLAFISIILELVLGAAIFYVIIHIAHYLERDIASMQDPSGSAVYYVEKFGEIIFLAADCVIALFFVIRGIKRLERDDAMMKIGVFL
jgi:hypothetical protein